MRGVARCPFHDEKTGSFHVWRDHYHCFGCGARGDVIAWLMALHAIPFRDAVAELERRCGVKVGERIVRQPMESEILAAEAAEWYAACKHCKDLEFFERWFLYLGDDPSPREIVDAYRSVRCPELRAVLAERKREGMLWDRIAKQAISACLDMDENDPRAAKVYAILSGEIHDA